MKDWLVRLFLVLIIGGCLFIWMVVLLVLYGVLFNAPA